MRRQETAEFVMHVSAPTTGEALLEDTFLLTNAAEEGTELLAYEPETEEEAAGWEIVDARIADTARRRTQSAGVDEVSDGLMMGCLDPECDAYFGEGCQKYKCAACRLAFCERHVVLWQVIGGARARSGSRDGSSGDSFVSMNSDSVAQILELLGVPMGAAAFLCKDCRTMLTPPGPEQFAEHAKSSPPLLPTNVAEVAMEAQALMAVPFSVLKLVDAAEDPSKAVARALLLRLLERLRICLRPWVDQERAWVWSHREALVEDDASWIAQFARQARWENVEDAIGVDKLIDKAHRKLCPRSAVQVLGSLGRHAPSWAQSTVLGERRLGMITTYIAEVLGQCSGCELACCLEQLLDAAEALGAAGAIGGRRAVISLLHNKSTGDVYDAILLRGEFFWSLEARAGAAMATNSSQVATLGAFSQRERLDGNRTWARVALEELLRIQPPEVELGLLRQRIWVHHMERGETDATKQNCWSKDRAFPLAAWRPTLRCLGLQGIPREASSANKPLIVRCGCIGVDLESGSSSGSAVPTQRLVRGRPATVSVTNRGAAPESSAGLLIKRETLMHMEQQVGQTLRLLERIIWEDENMRTLLEKEGLTTEDVRATYVITMTSPGVAMVEFVEGSTLRDIRSGKAMASESATLFAPAQRGTIREFLKEHNPSTHETNLAITRLAFTAAVSAVLSFVAGLGDRHHENFMVTTGGRLVHVDYGYALGREPLDSLLIHLVTQGGRPMTTLQFEELSEAFSGQDHLKRIFWPVVHGAYLRVRQHANLMLEMVYTAQMRLPRNMSRSNDLSTVQAAWEEAQTFVAQRCVAVLSEACAVRFIHTLLVHCSRHEAGSQWRDTCKNYQTNIGENTREAVQKAYEGLMAGKRNAGPALVEVSSAAKGAASSLFRGVRELWAEATSAADEEDSVPKGQNERNSEQ